MTESVHSLSGAYVVDALDDDERELFERHLPGCPDCRREVASLREAAAAMADAVAVPPPATLRDSVLGGIRSIRPLPPETEETSEPDEADDADEPAQPATVVALRRRRFHPARLVAAAAAILVIGAGAIYHPWREEPPVSTISAADQVLTAPDAQKVSVGLGDGSRADVYRSRSKGRAVIVTHGMPAPPSGKAYEVWLQDPSGRMNPAGLMTKAGDNKILLHGDATDATHVGITVEPREGSDQPTTKPIALLTLDKGTA